MANFNSVEIKIIRSLLVFEILQNCTDMEILIIKLIMEGWNFEKIENELNVNVTYHINRIQERCTKGIAQKEMEKKKNA